MAHLSKEEEGRPWSPLSPKEVKDKLDSISAPWWIAGGYAIEFSLVRNSGIMEILIF